MSNIKKIVIIGPESTGKSTLCSQLAAHYQTIWCPEYARHYLLKNGTDYSFNDLLTIAKGQLLLEEYYLEEVKSKKAKVKRGKSEEILHSGTISKKQSAQITNHKSQITNPLLFLDTDMYVMKVWCEFVFGQCHQWILNKIVERKYDLYLLCKPDLPWVKDELREYPDLQSREKLYHIYKDILVNQPVPWVEINGGYEERLTKAIEAVDQL